MDTFPAFQKVAYGEDGVREKYCYASIFAAERQRYEIAMGKICEELGYEPKFWYENAELTKDAVESNLWDEKKKWYGVIHEDGALDARVGLDGVFLLAYGLVKEDRANVMEANFMKLIGEYGFRTTAPDEPGYRANSYWRGPSWPQSCSIGMQACAIYYHHLCRKLLDAVTRMALLHPNVWECYVADNGDIAKTDQGFMCSPAVSSNVGAGGILGSIWTAHGFNMYGIDNVLPLTFMKDFHWAGMRITVNSGTQGWEISASAQERSESQMRFVLKEGKIYDITLKAGQLVCLKK